MEERVLYDGFYLNEQGKRIAPDISQLLDKTDAIGANCGFHHPDSHDYCPASVKVDHPITLTYKITPFPGEKNTEDNSTTVTLTVQDLEGHAQALSSIWSEQEQKEVEEEKFFAEKKGKSWK